MSCTGSIHNTAVKSKIIPVFLFLLIYGPLLLKPFPVIFKHYITGSIYEKKIPNNMGFFLNLLLFLKKPENMSQFFLVFQAQLFQYPGFLICNGLR